ncbi:MAG TPA: pitrilysin family protein [Candidatus Gastranaerophilaceae bacterium]|nr:pitrilysin family protein [Candidatus Gastranaerophilaceae bacterium]
MKINPIISFKSNIEALKTPPHNAVATNPIQNSQDLQATALDYKVKTPMKYSDLGELELPCSTKGHLYKLENGQRVVIITKIGPTVVKTYVNSGSMNEPDKFRGISHFIEHNLFNGSEGLSAGQFFDTVNKMGANTNASTGFAATDYYIESNLLKKSDLEKEIKIHASMLEKPTFALDMIEKEKGPVTSEINMILDDPENIATNNTLKMLFNINSTSEDIIGGTVDNIKKITREDVIDYYKKNYSPQNMVTVITGEAEPQEAIGLVSKYFSSNNTNPKPRNYEDLKPIQKAVRRDIISDKTPASIISIGFVGPKNIDTKDKILLDAFQFFMIGSNVSRLNKSLERIQTNALMTSDRISTRPQDNTVILFSTQVSEENSEKAIQMIFSEIANLENDPPSEKELNIVKKKLKLNLAQVFENSQLINTAVGTSMLDNDLKSVMEFEKVIDNMTSSDIVNFAKNYFNLNKAAMTVVHPNTVNAEAIKQNYQRTHNVSFTGNLDEINHKTALDLSKVKRYGITNNFSVATNEIHNNLATFDLSLSAEKPADIKPGVSNILAIMLNRGSKFKNEKDFFSDLENQGVSTQFYASERGIGVTSMFLPQDGKLAMKSAKEVILNPRFKQEELDYAKNILRENIKNTPKISMDGLMKEMFKGQFYGNSLSDILNNLDGIQMADVMSLYNYIVQNAQGTVAISAPFEKNPDLKSEIFSELCSDFPTLKPSVPSLFNGFIPVRDKSVVVQEHNKSQAEIQMGYKFAVNGNLKDSIVFELMNSILGGTPSSRLFSDLREKQKLAYQVNSRWTNMDNSGILSLYIKTTTDDPQSGQICYDNLQKSLEGFNFHIQKMKNENVTEDELESAKLTLKNKILNASEMTSDKNSSLLSGLNSFYGLSKNNQLLDMIDSISADDIKKCANYVFNSNPTVSVVATKNTIENNKDYLASLGNIVRM